MGKHPVYKIVASVIFILAVVFLFLLYKEISQTAITVHVGIYMGGLLFMSFFSFIMLFWVISMKPKAIVVYEKVEEQKVEEKLERKDELIISLDVEKSVGRLLFDCQEKSNIEELSEQILRNFANEFSIVQGLVFVKDKTDKKFKVSATFAFYSNEAVREFSEGEGISGQVAKNKKLLNIDNIPENYVTVLSGLGSSTPDNLLIIPFVYNDETIAVLELAAFSKFPEHIEEVYEQISEKMSNYIHKLLR